MKKARYRIEYKYLWMDENGPVIGVDPRPLNLRARLQKTTYIVNCVVDQAIAMYAIESFLEGTQQLAKQAPKS